jgi:protein-S-isoprenylcysteine O-methyltransferase Ste14
MLTKGENLDWLTVFKIIQLIVVFIFIVFISDIRKKPKSTPLINQRMLLALKLCYLVPISVYIYSLVLLSSIGLLDLLALTVTIMGTSIAAIAKITLADKHTWTGYCLDGNCYTTKGIYAYIRHPLYTGIYLFIFGGLLTLIPNTTLLLNIVVFLSLCYIMPFLAIVARRETKFLSKQFGDSFIQYQKEIHPFLPMKKYKQIV